MFNWRHTQHNTCQAILTWFTPKASSSSDTRKKWLLIWKLKEQHHNFYLCNIISQIRTTRTKIEVHERIPSEYTPTWGWKTRALSPHMRRRCGRWLHVGHVALLWIEKCRLISSNVSKEGKWPREFLFIYLFIGTTDLIAVAIGVAFTTEFKVIMHNKKSHRVRQGKKFTIHNDRVEEQYLSHSD